MPKWIRDTMGNYRSGEWVIYKETTLSNRTGANLSGYTTGWTVSGPRLTGITVSTLRKAKALAEAQMAKLVNVFALADTDPGK